MRQVFVNKSMGLRDLWSGGDFPSPAPKASSSNLFNTPKKFTTRLRLFVFLLRRFAYPKFGLITKKMMQISSLPWGIKVRSQCGNIDCFMVCETPTQPPPSQEEEHTCNLCNSLQTIKFIWNHHLSFVLSHLV